MVKKLLLIFLCISSVAVSQNTVGIISATNEVYDGFTLFSVHKKSFLINNCGEKINEWTSDYPPGNAVYLLPNGNLLRAGRNDGQSTITFGGSGGVVELFDWDGNLLWQFEYNNNQMRQHHDVFPMPNGNVLILAATVMTEAEALQAGRDPSLLTDNELYNEQIIEVEPVGLNQANIVWEWNIKDHLIQDFDNTKDNFGVVGDHPEKLDINFINDGGGGANWLHINSMQYNHDRNQIVLSSRNLSEVWIIDHSTTTAEAATGSGGTYGKGGDLLYRWGNPQSYDQGTETDRKLYGQHFPHFIEDGLVDAGKIILFNNGNGRTPVYSEVMIFDPPTTSPGVYEYVANTAYGPLAEDYSYSDQTNNPSDFFSAIVSGAQRLPNGNILVCQGINGRFFELNASDEIVWEYINPMSNNTGTIFNQTETPSTNLTFRAIKYSKSYGAFTGRDLTPGTPIEGNPDLSPCAVLSTYTVSLNNTIKVYPNPALDRILIQTDHEIDHVLLYSPLGKKVGEFANTKELDISYLNSGIYYLKISSNGASITKKVIKK